jgi:hypothetical protein
LLLLILIPIIILIILILIIIIMVVDRCGSYQLERIDPLGRRSFALVWAPDFAIRSDAFDIMSPTEAQFVALFLGSTVSVRCACVKITLNI